MQTRPDYVPPQTIKQAKAAYKKYGPRLSEREVRQLERGAELQRRADSIREAEKRRKVNQKRKAEKEERERVARRRMNIASQKEYIGPSQIRLDCFVKVDDTVRSGRKERSGLDGEHEPWEKDNLDDELFLDALDTEQTPGRGRRGREPAQHCSRGERDVLASKDPFQTYPPTTALDDLDSFLASNTQIERELTTTSPLPPLKRVEVSLPPLSTQDLNFDDADIEELGLMRKQPKELKTAGSLLMPPPSFIPVRKPQQSRFMDTAVSFSPDDFILSTQDVRDISG